MGFFSRLFSKKKKKEVEPVKSEPVVAKEEPKKEVEPVAKEETKKEEVKPTAKEEVKKEEVKPVTKPAAKKEPKVKQAPKKEIAKEKEEPEDKGMSDDEVKAEQRKSPENKNYHVSLRKSDGKWQVKFAKGQRAIKLFDTQAEAIDYAKTLAKNQEGSITIHMVDGKIRKQKY